MIHTVCITKKANGEYVIHNAYEKKGSTGIYIAKDKNYVTLYDAICNIGEDSSSICIIGIKEKLEK